MIGNTLMLDNNALNYAFERTGLNEDDLRAVREALRSGVRDQEFVVVGAMSLLEEIVMTVPKNPTKYKAMVRFAFDLVQHRWLWPLNERLIRELREGGPLPDARRHLPRNMRRQMRRLDEDLEAMKGLADDVHGGFVEFKDYAEEARQKVLDELGGSGATASDVRSGMTNWWSEGGNVEGFARDVLAEGVRRGELDADRVAAITDVEAMCPSLWHYLRYRMARVVLEIGEGRRVERSDEYDARYYSAAASYADVFVTDDGRFRETYDLVADRPFALMTFDELVASLQSPSPTPSRAE